MPHEADPERCPNRIEVTGLDQVEPEYMCGCQLIEWERGQPSTRPAP